MVKHGRFVNADVYTEETYTLPFVASTNHGRALALTRPAGGFE